MPIGVITPIDISVAAELTLDVHIPPDFLSTDRFERKLAESMGKIANEARDFWVSEAGRRLRSSRNQYQQAISVTVDGNSSFSLSLSGGFLPYAVEMGSPSFEMDVAKGQIVPLNVNREVTFSNPTVFRTGTGTPWRHPGFPGVNISSAVMDEIDTVLIPKYIQKIVEEL